MTEYKKEDDYTLLAINSLQSQGGGTLCRYFNFASAQVTTIFSQRADLTKEKEKGYDPPSVSVSVSTALTSQMSIQNFGDFNSMIEIEKMHELLKEKGGNPPPLDEIMTGKLQKPARFPLSRNN